MTPDSSRKHGMYQFAIAIHASRAWPADCANAAARHSAANIALPYAGS